MRLRKLLCVGIIAGSAATGLVGITAGSASALVACNWTSYDSFMSLSDAAFNQYLATQDEAYLRVANYYQGIALYYITDCE